MFEGLLSNNRMKAELTHQIIENKPMHAYLFCGAKGSGKLTAAKLLARELVGKNADKADRGSHPDIFILAPEKDKKLISVEQVRNMRNDAFVNPSEAPRKIYIINGIHLMNDAGQNALLTILEQPPSFAIFILLSESREKVLATVRSRCAVFEMEYVDANEGATFLQKKLPELQYDKLVIAMNASGGNIGLAEQLVNSEEFEQAEKTCLAIAAAMADKNEYTLAKLLSPLSKEELSALLSLLAMFLRDIVMCRCTNSCTPVFKESVLQNRSLFDKIDINTLYDSIHGCENALELINANISCMLISASLAIQLCGGKQID